MFFIFLLLSSVYCLAYGYFPDEEPIRPSSDPAVDRCFCKLIGEIDDCSCSVGKAHEYNKWHIQPRLPGLLERDYFRYFQINLKRPCPFWVDDSACALRDCHVTGCKKEEIPPGLRSDEENNSKNVAHEKGKYTKSANQKASHTCPQKNVKKGDSCPSKDDSDAILGRLDTTISKESAEDFDKWRLYDDKMDTFCEYDDEQSENMTYVDLLKNPERFTGYEGYSANRIWHAVYKENCFSDDSQSSIFGKSADGFPFILGNSCLEKRVFHRLISGLHTSISIHLCKKYLKRSDIQLDSLTGLGPNWGPNVEEFVRRFDSSCEPQGPQRLKNLYFTWLVELRALAKAAPYLRQEMFYTGYHQTDLTTRAAVHFLLDELQNFPDHFDESRLFQGDPETATKLKDEFRTKFRNISRVMDCVGCDKCRLWGKIQVLGLGTALKILFSGAEIGPTSVVNSDSKSQFQLRRHEIAALFNAFGRLSESLDSLDLFRELVVERSAEIEEKRKRKEEEESRNN